MKKVSALIALALLAVAGTGLATTCAQDNVPGATLLVPYFRVSRNGTTSVGTDIPDVLGQTDTLMAITNVSNTGLIVHATVWNKYSLPLLDFNIPMTAKDTCAFRMKDILNGHLNVNSTTQGSITDSASTTTTRKQKDPCGINQTSHIYNPTTGFGSAIYIRFPDPDTTDQTASISVYNDPAFSGTFRRNVWDSLDESGDITTFTGLGANIIDDDNRCAGGVDGAFTGDFSGYMTFDVVNYCTNFFPFQAEYYTDDAIATAGWDIAGYTPNAIIGDVFYVDASSTNGNISGDPMVSLEFDASLDWTQSRTFYGRYGTQFDDPGTPASTPGTNYAFVGDGREPLGQRYAFRYLSDSANGLQSWAVVWRSDIYHNPDADPDVTLCDWWANIVAGNVSGRGYGLFDATHQLQIHTYDQDENEFVSGGPSGSTTSSLYIFLEAQRIDLLNSGDFNPAAYRGGWIDLYTPGFFENQTFVEIQHTGLGAFLSVGHGAALLDEGNRIDGVCGSIIEARQ
jgi:hypothetical protein